jgi:putative DNA primase/helicase
MLDSLLQTYIDLKWPIFPMTREKRPLTNRGYRDATVDQRVIDDWVRRFPGCNWAVATGKISGITVVDVDGPQGEQTLYTLAEEGVVIDSPLQCLTGRGRHLYFKHDRSMKSSVGRLGPGLDIRADGGSATLPPSVHISGKRYEWIADPETTPIPHLPLSAFLHLYRPRARPSWGGAPSISLTEIVGKISSAVPGTRNHELNAAAYMAGKLVKHGKVSEDEAEQTLIDAGLAIGLDRHECQATVRSGLRAGAEL